jgi:hypothetical protein
MPKAKLKYNHQGPCNEGLVNVRFDNLEHSYRALQIWHKNLNQEDIAHDPHEPEKGDHVRGKPHGQKLNKGIPL